MTWAVHRHDRNRRFDFKSDGKLARRTRVHSLAGNGRQRIDVGGGIVIIIELLVVTDLDLLVGLRTNRKDAHVESAIIGLFEQPRVAAGLLVAIVNVAGALLFE